MLPKREANPARPPGRGGRAAGRGFPTPPELRRRPRPPRPGQRYRVVPGREAGRTGVRSCRDPLRARGRLAGPSVRRRYPNGRDRTPGFRRIESLHGQPCSSCPASAVTTEVGDSQTLNCVVLFCCIRSKLAAESLVKVEQPFGRRADQFEAELIGFQRLLAVADRRSARSLAYERGDFMAVMIAMPPRRIAHVNGRRMGDRARASSLCR